MHHYKERIFPKNNDKQKKLCKGCGGSQTEGERGKGKRGKGQGERGKELKKGRAHKN